jgi:hypothetical protein
MNRNSKYQKSIADEFLAIKDRVEFFIGHAHNGENGSFREIILMNYLRSIIPVGVSVGTGFVKNSNEALSKQIDIIVYRSSYPALFQEGDFVILMPESVLGIIEVKSTTSTDSIASTSALSAIKKATYNGKVIGKKDIFNGIFGYSTEMNLTHDFSKENMALQLKESNGYLNHIAFDAGYFMRYWEEGNPDLQYTDISPCYSFYDLTTRNITHGSDDGSGMAFGYFISNLLEVVYSNIIPEVLTRQYFEFLYPLEGTKETYRMMQKDIFLEV